MTIQMFDRIQRHIAKIFGMLDTHRVSVFTIELARSFLAIDVSQYETEI